MAISVRCGVAAVMNFDAISLELASRLYDLYNVYSGAAWQAQQQCNLGEHLPRAVSSLPSPSLLALLERLSTAAAPRAKGGGPPAADGSDVPIDDDLRRTPLHVLVYAHYLAMVRAHHGATAAPADASGEAPNGKPKHGDSGNGRDGKRSAPEPREEGWGWLCH